MSSDLQNCAITEQRKDEDYDEDVEENLLDEVRKIIITHSLFQ